MWGILEALLGLAWTNRVAILNALIKYAPLITTWIPRLTPFIGELPKIVAGVQLVDPIVTVMVNNGLSPGAAVLKVVATKLAPHQMTREEEEAWFRRMNPTT